MEYTEKLSEILKLYPNCLRVITENTLRVLDINNPNSTMWDDISHMNINFYKACVENNIFLMRKGSMYFFIKDENSCRWVDMNNESEIKKLIRLQKLTHIL